jgi:hypothetical protein
MESEYGLDIGFLGVLELDHLRFLESALLDIDNGSHELSDLVIRSINQAEKEHNLHEYIELIDGWSVIGVRIDGSVSAILGGNVSVDYIFNFTSKESSVFLNLNGSAGIQGGWSVGGGLFLGFNAPNNDVYKGWGSSATISASAGNIGGGIQMDVSDRFYMFGIMSERHKIDFDNDAWNLTIMYVGGEEVELSIGIGHSFELHNRSYQ